MPNATANPNNAARNRLRRSIALIFLATNLMILMFAYKYNKKEFGLVWCKWWIDFSCQPWGYTKRSWTEMNCNLKNFEGTRSQKLFVPVPLSHWNEMKHIPKTACLPIHVYTCIPWTGAKASQIHSMYEYQHHNGFIWFSGNLPYSIWAKQIQRSGSCWLMNLLQRSGRRRQHFFTPNHPVASVASRLGEHLSNEKSTVNFTLSTRTYWQYLTVPSEKPEKDFLCDFSWFF